MWAAVFGRVLSASKKLALTRPSQTLIQTDICIYYFIVSTTSDYITWVSSAYLHMCVSDWQLRHESVCNSILGIVEGLDIFNWEIENLALQRRKIYIFFLKSRNYIVNCFIMTRKSGEYLSATYGNTGHLFRPY